MCGLDKTNITILNSILESHEFFSVGEIEGRLQKQGMHVASERICNALSVLQSLGYVLQYNNELYSVNENIVRRQTMQYA